MRREDKNLKNIFAPVRSDLNRFDAVLDEQLQADSDLIQSVINHLLEKRGKRIRPTFLFLTARCSGYNHRRMVEAALGIELIHTATLLHDDVVDESDTRRGHESINYRWNNLTAILMGDFLFAKAFKMLVATDSPKLVALVAETTERVSIGELRQLEESGNFELSEEMYLDIIAAKTASLFSAAASSGAVLNKADSREVKRLSDFGEKLGTSFQIADDLLDIVGEQSKIGKEVGSDLMQGKATLPLIYALRNSGEKVRTEIVKILSNGTKPTEYQRVIEFIGNSGGIDYARERAMQFGESGLKLIRKYGDSKYSAALEQVVQFTVNREN